MYYLELLIKFIKNCYEKKEINPSIMPVVTQCYSCKKFRQIESKNNIFYMNNCPYCKRICV